jgi:hypothetical protein
MSRTFPFFFPVEAFGSLGDAFVLFECLLVEQIGLCMACHTLPDTAIGQAAESSVPAAWVAPSADDAELLKVLEAANAEILRVWIDGSHGNQQPTTPLASHS